MKHLDKVIYIQNKLKEVDKLDLPTLPSTYYQIEELITKNKATVNNLSEIIQSDPSLTAKILMLVNSASFGLRQEIKTLSRAINIIGFNELSNLVLATAVIKMFPPYEGAHFSLQKFWEHSIAVGTAAKIIAKNLNRKFMINAQEAFTAGLIHDIGKLVMKEFYPTQFGKALIHCKTYKTTLADAEDSLFGYNHQHIGHALAREWKLPSIYHSAIGFHHHPQEVSPKHPHFAMIAVVHLANILAKANLLGSGGDPFIPNIESITLEALQLSHQDFEHMIIELEAQATETESLLTNS